MRAPLHRLLSYVVLLAWMAPSLGALSAGLHLAIEHHGPHGAEHVRAITDLAGAATHGHHHDLDTAPHHGHEATSGGSVSLPRPAASLLTALPSPGVSAGSDGRWPLDRASRRGPPGPLLMAYCSLLL